MSIHQMMMEGGVPQQAQRPPQVPMRVQTAMAFAQIMGARFYRVRNCEQFQTARPLPLTPAEDLAYCAAMDLLELYFRGGADGPPMPPAPPAMPGPPDPPQPPTTPPTSHDPAPIHPAPHPNPVTA